MIATFVKRTTSPGHRLPVAGARRGMLGQASCPRTASMRAREGHLLVGGHDSGPAAGRLRPILCSRQTGAGAGLFPREMQIAHIAHASLALLSCAIVGHIYMGTVGVRGAYRAMTTDEEPGWANTTCSGTTTSRGGKIQARHPVRAGCRPPARAARPGAEDRHHEKPCCWPARSRGAASADATAQRRGQARRPRSKRRTAVAGKVDARPAWRPGGRCAPARGRTAWRRPAAAPPVPIPGLSALRLLTRPPPPLPRRYHAGCRRHQPPLRRPPAGSRLKPWIGRPRAQPSPRGRACRV